MRGVVSRAVRWLRPEGLTRRVSALVPTFEGEALWPELLAIACFLLLPWIGVVVALSYEDRRATAAAVESTANLAQALEENTRRTIGQIDSILLSARSLRTAVGNRFDFHAWARTQTLPDRMVAQIATADRDGLVTNSTMPFLPGIGLAVSLLVPFSMVMATGRQNSMVELYSPLRTSTVVTFGDAPRTGDLGAVGAALGDGGLVPYAMVSDIVLRDDPYAATPPGVLVTDLAALPAQVDFTVTEGDTSQVAGDHAATAGSRFAAGDHVSVLLADGSERMFTVTTVISDNSYLSADLVLDYATNADLVTEDAQVRGFSSATPDRVAEALDSGGVQGAEILTRDEWIQAGLDEVSTSQRQALAMMFVLPCLMAAVATALGIRAYSAMTARSRAQMRSVGFTRADLRREHGVEIGLQLAVIVVEVAATTALAWWKVTAIISDNSTFDLSPSIDIPVTAIGAGFLLAVFLASHVLQRWHAVRRTDG